MAAEIDARTKQSVQHAQIGALESYRAGGGVFKALGEGASEVVGHFTFEFHALVSLERRPRANAQQIGISLRNAEIIRENAYLNVLVILSKCARRQTAGKKQ